jgi:hypothetical protein
MLLSTSELAYARAWAEGLDLRAAWLRYVANEFDDERWARRELERVLNQMRILARSHGRQDLAALLCRDPERIVETRPSTPTLEEFADRQPADFFSQAELLEMYQAEYGTDQPDSRSSARRRQRLRTRMVSAMQWFAGVTVKAPEPADPVARWLDKRDAERLRDSGIVTVGQLMTTIASKGHRWHRDIQRLGPIGATRIQAWLAQHEDQLGALPAHALRPLRQLDTSTLAPGPRLGLVPLERFMPPEDPYISGALGANRGSTSQPKGTAQNDAYAISVWLSRWPAGSNTWRAYRKEAERLLLWAVIERGKAVSSLGGEDRQAYLEFLDAPPQHWIGKRCEQRWKESWRPLEGPLTAASKQRAAAACASMLEWLWQVGYLAMNPWSCRGAARCPSLQ